MAESLPCSPETTTTLLIGYTQYKIKSLKLKKRRKKKKEAYRGINYLILQNRRQKRWRTIKVDHVLKFFSFYFFIPLSQQYYCGIASHFGKSPYFDVKFSYLDDFLKVLVFSRGGRSCWMWPWTMPGGARPGWNCDSSSLLLISQRFFIL